jgi:cytochrome c oxidase subunit II
VRKGAIVRVVAIGLLVGAASAVIAIAIPWLPDQASEEAEWIDLVFWFTTAICIAIFSLVAAVTIYSVVKFRVRPDDDSDGPPIHGHTGLEIVWTAIPTALVTAIAILSAVALAKNQSIPDDKLTVEVTARQFAWSFKYPQYGDIQSSTLYLPKGRTAELELTALEVIHSFWVPEFRQKQDAVPGQVTRIAVTPTKTGRYSVVCTELCGLGHALMRTSSLVVEEPEFERWARQQRTASAAGSGG